MLDDSFHYNPEIENMRGNNEIWKDLFNATKKATDGQKEEALKKLYSMCQLEVLT